MQPVWPQTSDPRGVLCSRRSCISLCLLCCVRFFAKPSIHRRRKFFLFISFLCLSLRFLLEMRNVICISCSTVQHLSFVFSYVCRVCVFSGLLMVAKCWMVLQRVRPTWQKQTIGRLIKFVQIFIVFGARHWTTKTDDDRCRSRKFLSSTACQPRSSFARIQMQSVWPKTESKHKRPQK